MTPRETFEFLRSGAHSDHILWRDPQGDQYVLSSLTEERRYREEGYRRVGLVKDIRKELREITGEGVVRGSMLWVLMEDMHRQENE